MIYGDSSTKVPKYSSTLDRAQVYHNSPFHAIDKEQVYHSSPFFAIDKEHV